MRIFRSHGNRQVEMPELLWTAPRNCFSRNDSAQSWVKALKARINGQWVKRIVKQQTFQWEIIQWSNVFENSFVSHEWSRGKPNSVAIIGNDCFWHFNDSWLQFSDHCFDTEAECRQGGWVWVPALCQFFFSFYNLEVDWQSVEAVVTIKWKVALLINCRPPKLNDWGGCRNIITQRNSTQPSFFHKQFFSLFSVVARCSWIKMILNTFVICCATIGRLSVFVKLIKLSEKKTFAHSKRSVAVI